MRETLDLECKQKIDKGRHGWEIQERTKAAGESVQWYLHPILVKERHVRMLEGKAELRFCYLCVPFTGSNGILCGKGRGRVQHACYLEAPENYALTHTHYVL